MSDPVRVARTPGGALAYAVALPPDRLPAVTPRALLAAWDAARDAAAGHLWGPERVLVFHRPGAEPTRIAIADPDAGCWAEAVDRLADLGTLQGLALCLRLLALVEVMGRAPWLAGLFAVTRGGVELHPALLAAAASLPLDAEGRFEDRALRARLGVAPAPSGARALPVPLAARSRSR